MVLTCIVVSPLRAADYSDRMTPETQAAADRGLAYLARTQNADGSFAGEGRFVGLTATGALAFMAFGHVPGSGKYGAATSKAVQYILNHAQTDGLLYRPGAGPHPMYHHALACLALSEAWGQTGDHRMREVLRKAVDLIISSQNHRGGWRYEPKPSSDDLSVTVMQLMALRAAKDAGMDVPKETIDAGIEYVKMCHNGKGAGKDGGFAYTPGGGSGWALTAAGITSLQVAGNYRATEVLEGIDYLLQRQPVGDIEVEDAGWYFYGAYYGTMGMYQAQSLGAFGRRAWDRWYPAITRDLLSKQREDGSWGGRHEPYPTVQALQVLAIPYRYLPVYQR